MVAPKNSIILINGRRMYQLSLLAHRTFVKRLLESHSSLLLWMRAFGLVTNWIGIPSLTQTRSIMQTWVYISTLALNCNLPISIQHTDLTLPFQLAEPLSFFIVHTNSLSTPTCSTWARHTSTHSSHQGQDRLESTHSALVHCTVLGGRMQRCKRYQTGTLTNFNESILLQTHSGSNQQPNSTNVDVAAWSLNLCIKHKHSQVTRSEQLSEQWNIGLTHSQAKNTTWEQAMTQYRIRSAVFLPLTWR